MINPLYWVDALFGICQAINASMFLVQFSVLLQKKSAEDISLITFSGFSFIQIITILYSYLHSDKILMYGTIVNFGMCMMVIVTALYFRLGKNRKNPDGLIDPDLKEIIALIPANVYWIDRNGIFLGCNNRMLSMLNLKSVDSYRGKTYEDFYEITHIQKIKANDEEVMASNTAKTIEEVAYPYKTYLTNKIPLHNKAGQVIGLLGVSIDISEMKETQHALLLEKKRAEVANIAKTEFLYNMRHDIRTPLSNVIGLTKFLLDNESDTMRKEIINDIATSSESLMSLLEEMLEFSNVEEGIYPIRHSCFNLKEVLHKIQSIMSSAISLNGINFNIKYDDKIPNLIIGDLMRTHRILLNLVSNAIKFTKSGKVEIIVDLIEETERQYYFKIQIIDTGIGISEENIDFIFGRFNKVQLSAMGIESGSGLGLSIVKQFVDDLNGEIYVESEIGKGSNFVFVIPYLKPLEMSNIKCKDISNE